MRVLIVSHLYPSDRSPYRGLFVKEQVDRLANYLEVKVLSLRFDAAESPAHCTEAAGGGVEVQFAYTRWHRFLPGPMNVALAAAVLRRRVRRLLESEKFDVVHAHYAMPDGVAALDAGIRRRIPVVVTVHGSDINRQLQRPFVGAWLARRLARSSRVICVSPHMTTELRERFPQLAARCVTIPNGYNDAEIGFERTQSRDSVLFVGGLSQVKNPSLVLKSFASLKRAQDLRLVFVGDGPLRSALEQLAARLGLGDRVVFEGAVAHQRLSSFYARARVLVLPSSSEGLPIVALEALASGVPIVCTPVGGLPELIRSGENGFIVPVGDVAGTARALEHSLVHDWDRERISRDAAVLTWTEVAGRVIQLYAEVTTE